MERPMAETKTARGGSTRSAKKTSRNGSQSRESSNGGERAKAEEQTPKKGDEQGGTLQRIASKAKTPALAGGAAIAGLAGGIAGGIAISRNGRGRLPRMKDSAGNSTKTALRTTAKALGTTAVQVGKAGFRAGELAEEVRRVREQASQRDG
jgi:hypothetical protein